MRLAKHILIITAALFVCLGVPFLYFVQKGTLFGSTADAMSGASLVIPDQPSGTFYVLLNTERHPLTEQEWNDFFSEREVGVIMEDIHCLVTRGDTAGRDLADRYQARLAENQMEITAEDGTLVVSKAEQGLYDVIILSSDIEPAYDYSRAFEKEGTLVIAVEGEGQ